VIVVEVWADSGCTVELNGTFAFVDGGGGNGCVTSQPGVSSCSEDLVDTNMVKIVIGAAGVPLPPASSGPLNLATIRLLGVTPVTAEGEFFLRASTAVEQVSATFGRCCSLRVSTCSSSTCSTGAA